MNLLLENQLIEEKEYESNLAYIIKDKQSFVSTEYKVLRGQSENGLIRCMRGLYNGNLQLIYLINDRKSLSDVISKLSENEFLNIFSKLLKIILDVKRNGFLKCEKLNVSIEKIYIDMNTLDPALIYSPLSENVYNNFPTFENEFRTNFVKLINTFSNINGNKSSSLKFKLSDGTISIDKLLENSHNTFNATNTINSKQNINIKKMDCDKNTANGGTGYLRLISLNTPNKLEFVIDKKEYLIGKDPQKVNGFIDSNAAISRVHCKISCVKNQFFLTDVGSTNGTYLNEIKLLANQPKEIVPGDIVKLANSSFQLVLR